MSAAEPTATSVATAATHSSGSPRHAGSSALPSGIILAPGSASAAVLPSRSFQTSFAAADGPPDVAAARGFAPVTDFFTKPLFCLEWILDYAQVGLPRATHFS